MDTGLRKAFNAVELALWLRVEAPVCPEENGSVIKRTTESTDRNGIPCLAFETEEGHFLVYVTRDA